MGGFESSAHAAGLLAAAAVMSLGLVFLINADPQTSRNPALPETLRQEQDAENSKNLAQNYGKLPININHPSFILTKLFGDSVFREPQVNYRAKRSPDFSYNQIHHGNMESNSAEPGSKPTEFHKIRHAMKRLGGGGLDGDDFLRMILDSKHILSETGNQRSPVAYHPKDHAEHLPLKQHFGSSNENEQHFQELRQRKYEYEEKITPRPNIVSVNPRKPEIPRSNIVSLHPSPSKQPSSSIVSFDPSKSQTSRSKIFSIRPSTTPIILEFAIAPEEISVPPVAKIVDFAVTISVNESGIVAHGTNETTRPRDSHGHENRSTFVLEKFGFCYKRDDVLLVILITSCLNFTFVLLIWASVKWLSSSSCGGTDKEKHFHPLDCEDFHQPEASEYFWSPNVVHGSRTLTNLRKCRASSSLHNFRSGGGDYVPQQISRRSQWSSMEELRYAQA